MEALAAVGEIDSLGSISPFDALCQIQDVIHPAVPGKVCCAVLCSLASCRLTCQHCFTVCVSPCRPVLLQITCMDIKRSGSGPVVFDVLVTVSGGPASINYLV